MASFTYLWNFIRGKERYRNLPGNRSALLDGPWERASLSPYMAMLLRLEAGCQYAAKYN